MLGSLAQRVPVGGFEAIMQHPVAVAQAGSAQSTRPLLSSSTPLVHTSVVPPELLDALDDDDDVQNVFGNYAIDQAELERLAG